MGEAACGSKLLACYASIIRHRCGSFSRLQTVALTARASFCSEAPLDLWPERTPRAPGGETGFVRSYCTGRTPWRSLRGGQGAAPRNIRLRKVERPCRRRCPPHARVVFTDTYRMVTITVRGRRTSGASPPARRCPHSTFDRQNALGRPFAEVRRDGCQGQGAIREGECCVRAPPSRPPLARCSLVTVRQLEAPGPPWPP
jgi:hypothetical protein